MDELPSRALRNKKDSSMRVALNLVKEGRAEACISAGNTGALVAISKFVLKTLPGISRPAITTHFPTVLPDKTTNVLDLGANVDSSSEFLVQLAVMGTVLASEVDGIARPKVALLNIGSEEIKGNEQVKEAAQLLAHYDGINYVGFVEGNTLFEGDVDVVVCDGFIGNVTLKTIEGAFNLVKAYAKRSLLRNWFTKLLTVLALPLFRRLKREIDPDRYNGASLVGLNGVVVKSHGGANVVAFASALEKAIVEARRNVPQKISEAVAELLPSKAQN